MHGYCAAHNSFQIFNNGDDWTNPRFYLDPKYHLPSSLPQHAFPFSFISFISFIFYYFYFFFLHLFICFNRQNLPHDDFAVNISEWASQFGPFSYPVESQEGKRERRRRERRERKREGRERRGEEERGRGREGRKVNSYYNCRYVGHSQGGAAGLHLKNYYFSGLDYVTEGRVLQSIGTPYQVLLHPLLSPPSLLPLPSLPSPPLSPLSNYELAGFEWRWFSGRSGNNLWHDLWVQL